MDVCVITGGSGGIGIETAKLVGKNKKIIIVGRSVEKLEKAISELKKEGLDAEYFQADVSNRESIKRLVEFSKQKGNIKIVIHSAGISPNMSNSENIFTINACGTIIVNEEFLPEMGRGGVILNVSSMAAYLLDLDKKVLNNVFKLSLESIDAFSKGFEEIIKNFPKDRFNGYVYTLSKKFVIWYTEQMALKYGKNGIRVVSISPGTVATNMSKTEGQNSESMGKMGALGRVGEPIEIAKVMSFLVSDDCSYITGVDILCDGGSVAAFHALNNNQ